MSSSVQVDLAVLGAGPGGYVAALRAAQLGAKVALIEAKEVGGTCLNRGCIPSKALIANAELWKHVQQAGEFGITTGALSFDYGAMARRKDKIVAQIRQSLEGLIRSHAIQIVYGRGALSDAHTLLVSGSTPTRVTAEQIILATGSEPREVGAFPFDHQRILDSTDLLALQTIPRSLLVIGGGVIGCEFASLYANLGVDVTLIEALPEIISTEGAQLGGILREALTKRGIKILVSTPVEALQASSNSVKATLKGGETVEAELAVVAVGRAFNTRKIGYEQAGVYVSERGIVPVNDRMQTNLPHIYAIGDITGQWLYAHYASFQGVVAAENACGKTRRVISAVCPGVIFTDPEVASVGLTLEKAKEQGYQARTGRFPFAHLGKSQASGHTEGFAQVVIDEPTGLILGAQCVGEQASVLIAEMTLAIANELIAPSVSETIHAHPTLSEAWQEAVLLAQEMPLHSPPMRRRS